MVLQIRQDSLEYVFFPGEGEISQEGSAIEFAVSPVDSLLDHPNPSTLNWVSGGWATEFGSLGIQFRLGPDSEVGPLVPGLYLVLTRVTTADEILVRELDHLRVV